MKAPVTFLTSYLDSNYIVETAALIDATSTDNYVITINDKITSGFTINMNANSLPGLLEVMWFTIPFSNP
jgi:hypothetical protein